MIPLDLPSPEQPLRFGVNYTPSKDWMFWWMDPDWSSLRRDFESIAGLGADHVRVLPLWPQLQPNRSLIRPQGLQDLRRVVDCAAEFGLDVCVDVIQGHLSSFDFLPSWLTSWHTRNMFTDPEAISGQVDLVRAIAEAVDGAPNLIGLTLGNEVNQFSDKPHPTPQPASVQQVTAWIETLLDAADTALPRGEHSHAEYDAVWYQDGHPFTPAHASRWGSMTTIHSWVFNGTAQAYGGMSQASVRHAEYLIELSRAFATDLDRPIWLQEVGAPLNCMTVQDAPSFAEQTIRAAATTENLWGVTWWCSHDVARSLVDFPELEYTLGLIDSSNRIKPIGRAVAETVADLRERRPAVEARSTAVVIEVDDDDVPLSRASLGPRGAAMEAWNRVAETGIDPGFVLSSQLSPAALEARGITELVRVREPEGSGIAGVEAVDLTLSGAGSTMAAGE